MFLKVKYRFPVDRKFRGIIRNSWIYIVIFALIKTCYAYQGPTVTTVTPPPHRGAARQMYGSGSLRPPGSIPIVYGTRQRPSMSRTPPSPSPNVNHRRFTLAYPVVPIPVPMREYDTYPLYMPEYFPGRIQISSTKGGASNRGGMYGGRREYYDGRPDRGDFLYPGRYPMDAILPGKGFEKMPLNPGRAGVVRFMPSHPHGTGIQTMRQPTEEDGLGGSEGDVIENTCQWDCDMGEFLCAASCACIKSSARCDGDIDCVHEEDELGCGEIDSIQNDNCQDTEKYVRCAHSGKCISKDWLCDGDDDCGDYSDETQCGLHVNCTDDQFECGNGLCIPKSWLCDNDNDCKDFSDEINCTKLGCTEDEFTCSDQSCISLSWECDKEPDCNDGSDESDCDIEPPSCNEGEFQCTYQKCIKVEFRCDGDDDCGDWSDEDNCAKSPGNCVAREFKCNSGKCIPETWKCDRQQDCEDNEDEINCTESNTRSCSPEEFTCNSGACLLKNWVCDGVSDCDHDEDESDCLIECDDETKFACMGETLNDTRTKFCISKKHVCDGQRDCPKGEDEKDCPTKHDCDKDSKCTQVCITHTDGKEACTCQPGYKLSKDEISCEDVNECLYETDPVCSQTCNNTIGSFRCGCMTGYILRPDLRSCKALGAPPTLLFANRIDIRQVSLQVSLSNTKYTALLKGLHNAIALDYHYKKGLIFWSDVSKDVIRKAYINGTGSTDVIKWGLESPGGVALDWVHDLIFWTDSGTRRVEVASLDGKQRSIIVANDLDKPRAIVVHPGEAYIFWTDWGPTPKIERSEMDGSNRKSIITESVFWPNGLTLDYTNNRIYWADAKHNVIETALYDGSDRKKVISKGLPHPFALTIFEDAIYWTDWHTKSITTANKQTGAGLRTVHSNLHFPMDIHSYHPQRQPNYKNHCGIKNGGCEHFCLPNKKSFTCVCRMGQKLKDDGKNCEQPDKLLLFARKKDLRIKQLDTHAAHHNEMVIPIDGIKSAVAIAWDSQKDTIFWSDVEKDTINKAHWNGSNQEVIVKSNIVSPAGLAYDWFTDKIYWTDCGSAVIEVSASDGSQRSLIIWEGLDKPRDIVVDPIGGYMYWSDWGENPKIERAAMDGTMRSILIIQNLTWPNGLSIDHETSRLYWTDGGTSSIEYSDLDGKNRKILLEGEAVPHPFGLDVFGDDIYWTDWNTWNIEKINKQTGLNRTTVSKGISDLMDVRVFHRHRQYQLTQCNKDNGGCSNLCLLKPNGYTCACPIGITLEDNGKTCTDGPIKSLLLAHRMYIRQISLDVPYVVDVVLPFPSLKSVTSVDVDRQTGEIYWTDTASDVIMKSTLNGLFFQTIISKELQVADGIAIDSSGRKIYWTDSGRNSIEVAELDGQNRKVLIWRDLDSPKAITLYYYLGLMFWSDWGAHPKIEVAQMDGSNRRSIINEKVVLPNGLVIDQSTSRLYWNDGKLKTIESSDLNGRNRRVVITGLPHPYGLTLAGDHIYWTDWQTQGLHRAAKNGSDRTLIRKKLEGLMDVRFVQNDDNLDENACGLDNGGCSHLCLRNTKSYSCACPTGIKLIKGSSKTCEYQPSNYLLFATRYALARISLDTDELWDVTLPVKSPQHVIDVDFHWENELIYFSDLETDKIHCVSMRNLSEVRDIISMNISTPNGVSVDWIANNIYWTDAGNKIIEASNLDGDLRKVIIRHNLQEPRSIAVFPRKGYLYWTDWGRTAKIERSYLDGSSRKVIVNTDLGFPNGLTIDFKSRRLYWTDAKFDRIETSDMHGNNRIRLVYSSSSPSTRPFALGIYGQHIYWSDWYQRSIVRADKSSGKNPQTVRLGLEGAMGVTVVSASRQAGWNPCAVDNGGCTHLCFFKLTNYSCECPDLPSITPCKTEPKVWVSLTNPNENDDYIDEEDETYYNNDDLAPPKVETYIEPIVYVIFILPFLCLLILATIAIAIYIIYTKSQKKYLYATGRSVMTFSNPNYYTSNLEPGGPPPNLDKKPFLWKRLKYDKSQERVYEDKCGSSSPEVASLIPTVLTPSSSNCEAVTPELERSPSITPLHRINSLTADA